MAGRGDSPAVGRDEDAAECTEIVLERHRRSKLNMHMNMSIAPLVALLAGILILIIPRLLNYIVALYLIITGLLGLFGTGGSFHLR